MLIVLQLNSMLKWLRSMQFAQNLGYVRWKPIESNVTVYVERQVSDGLGVGGRGYRSIQTDYSGESST